MTAPIDNATANEPAADDMVDADLLAVPRRPLLRYHGGKWRLANWIIGHFPPHKVYVEPFIGAGSVMLRKPPAKTEVGNDKFGRIVNVFRVLRDPDHSQELLRRLRFTACAELEYHEAREVSPDPIEDARRMIVLGHQSHGSTGSSGGKLSGWRRGLRRHGQNSAKEWETLWEQVETWAARLRGVYLENGEATDVMKRWDGSATLHYVDPPYVAATRKTGACGYRHEMEDLDHENLAEVLHSLKGAVILSGYRSPFYDALYTGWNRVERAAFTDKGRLVSECLWLRNVQTIPDLFS